MSGGEGGRRWRVLAGREGGAAEELVGLEVDACPTTAPGHWRRVATRRELTSRLGVHLTADTELSAGGRRRQRPRFVPSRGRATNQPGSDTMGQLAEGPCRFRGGRRWPSSPSSRPWRRRPSWAWSYPGSWPCCSAGCWPTRTTSRWPAPWPSGSPGGGRRLGRLLDRPPLGPPPAHLPPGPPGRPGPPAQGRGRCCCGVAAGPWCRPLHRRRPGRAPRPGRHARACATGPSSSGRGRPLLCGRPPMSCSAIWPAPAGATSTSSPAGSASRSPWRWWSAWPSPGCSTARPGDTGTSHASLSPRGGAVTGPAAGGPQRSASSSGSGGEGRPWRATIEGSRELDGVGAAAVRPRTPGATCPELTWVPVVHLAADTQLSAEGRRQPRPRSVPSRCSAPSTYRPR